MRVFILRFLADEEGRHSVRHAHQRLAEILPFQHAHEGRRRILEPVGDVLAIADAAIGEAGRDGAQKIGVVLRDEFGS